MPAVQSVGLYHVWRAKDDVELDDKVKATSARKKHTREKR